MNNQQETLNTLILSAAWRFNLADLAELYRRVGSATALIDHHNDIRSVCPDASPRLVEVLVASTKNSRRRIGLLRPASYPYTYH